MATVEGIGDASDIHDAIRARLDAADGELLGKHPVATYVKQFDDTIRAFGYSHVPSLARLWVTEIEETAGAAAVEDYHRLVLATLIRDRGQREPPIRIPPSVHELLERWFVRVLTQLDAASEYFRHENDLFAKDFAICRQRLLPCGAEHIDVAGCIPRSTVLQGGAGQLFRGLKMFGVRRSNYRNWLEGHWDRRLFRDFTADQYQRCYARIADVLEANPGLHGWGGGSWWFDPALESLSPELQFLRYPMEHGAVLFRVGEDERATHDAILFSKERKAAVEAGRYRPMVYNLVWARDDIIRWARGGCTD